MQKKNVHNENNFKATITLFSLNVLIVETKNLETYLITQKIITYYPKHFNYWSEKAAEVVEFYDSPNGIVRVTPGNYRGKLIADPRYIDNGLFITAM